MTKYIKPTVSLHQRYYSNPLKPITPIWKIQLMFYSFKDTKRVSQKGMYFKMRWRNLGSVRGKKNPLVEILESKNSRRVWGKFHR